MRYFPWDVLTQCVLKRPERHKDRMQDSEKGVIRQKKYSAGVFLTAHCLFLFFHVCCRIFLGLKSYQIERRIIVILYRLIY